MFWWSLIGLSSSRPRNILSLLYIVSVSDTSRLTNTLMPSNAAHVGYVWFVLTNPPALLSNCRSLPPSNDVATASMQPDSLLRIIAITRLVRNDHLYAPHINRRTKHERIVENVENDRERTMYGNSVFSNYKALSWLKKYILCTVRPLITAYKQ